MKFRRSHQFKTFLILAAVAAFFTQPGCRSLQSIPSQWLAGADGRIEDFSNKITSHLFENGMMVGVGNDERFLYIFFSPDVRHRQRPPSRASLTLWLDETGGRAEMLGLGHVSDQQRNKMPPPAARSGEPKDIAAGPDRPQPPLAAAPAPALLKIMDRKNSKETFICADGSLGPAVRLADDWGDFAYQWRIPFQALGDWPGLNRKPGKAIGIGLLWKIEPLPGLDKKDLDRSRPGPGRGGPGGPPAGMESGPGSPGRIMPQTHFKAKRRIWLRTLLINR